MISKVKLPKVFHPQLVALKIPVTFLTLYLVPTVSFYLTNSWMPLVAKGSSSGVRMTSIAFSNSGSVTL